MRVFVTHNPEDLDAYFGRALVELQTIAQVVTNPCDRDLATDELIEAAAGCEVVVAHRSTPGESPLFQARPELVAFLRCAVDISTIDVDAASSAGVLVGRAAKSFVPSTAELALGLMLDVWRNVSTSTVDYRAGREPAQIPGRQARDKTAGIIGYGAVGSYLADLLVGLGMEVIVHDVAEVDQTAGVQQVGFVELLGRSDVVFPLAPAVPETVDLIDATALSAMKPGAIVINVSRGELVDEQAVADALDSGQLAGLGIDVGRAPDQRPSPNIAARPDVVATPHLGGLTPENADAQALSAVEQVAAMSAGEVPPRSVNPQDAFRLRAWFESRSG